MTPFRLLTIAEHRALELQRRSTGALFSDVFPPGVAYLCPWYYDPAKPNPDKVQRGLAGQSFLSVHYWRDWSAKRSPIMVMCPGGSQWCLDQKSANGDGWHITGTPESPTASPSIVVNGYHGWLREGYFSPDLEGRP